MFDDPAQGYQEDMSEQASGHATEDSTTTPTTGQPDTENPLRGSRTSAVWSSVVGLGILLVLLIVFIAQNTQRSEVNFLWWSGTAPQSVSLLIAATTGLALAVIAASLRILQLRRRVRRTR